MFIVPINSSIDASKFSSFVSEVEKVRSGAGIGGLPEEGQGESQGFRDIFQNLIDNVEKTEAVAAEDAYKLSIGELEDPHTAMINAAKAELTLSTMMQIRNKLVDAYSEVMRINL
ncbi:MAG: flagellar hook-basal body complex protein FliE [Clostridiales Family XIII bacterium]|jgi:flagellar hook-basal body complex protein FliE|nr:flagellar hook-basal body complex protein FliE [Clostridiales Family XIII bacterium]